MQEPFYAGVIITKQGLFVIAQKKVLFLPV